jgi:hypothetical protein
MEKLRTIYRFSVSLVLFPAILSIYMLDRLLLSLLIHLKSENFSTWIKDKDQIKATIIRVLVFYTMLLLVYFLN